MEFHADYSIVDVGANYIYIKDIGKNTKTVTNDADWVIKKLHDTFNIIGKRIFYMDTDLMIDELVHENGVFKAFRPGNMESRFQWEKVR